MPVSDDEVGGPTSPRRAARHRGPAGPRREAVGGVAAVLVLLTVWVALDAVVHDLSDRLLHLLPTGVSAVLVGLVLAAAVVQRVRRRTRRRRAAVTSGWPPPR